MTKSDGIIETRLHCSRRSLQKWSRSNCRNPFIDSISWPIICFITLTSVEIEALINWPWLSPNRILLGKVIANYHYSTLLTSLQWKLSSNFCQHFLIPVMPSHSSLIEQSFHWQCLQFFKNDGSSSKDGFRIETEP